MSDAGMTVGSLFAGIGGFDLAAERVGFSVSWQSEVDSHASTVLARHFDAPNLGDINDISEPPAVDVLCGGFPCQDYSVAGRRGGLAGDRGALWWQFHRLIDEGRPTWVVGENVPGLLSSNNGRDFRTIIGSLVELGYGVVWRVLDAQYLGVAQRRRRVFIVGHSGGQPRPEVLALGQGVSGDSPPSREAGPGATAGVSTSLKASGKVDHIGDESKLIASLAYNPHRTLNRDGTITSGFAARPVTDALHGPTGNKEPLVVQGGSQQDQFIRPEGISPTLAHASNSNHGHHEPKAWIGSTVRRLTPTECERLQGFPDGWTDNCSDTQRYRQLGNAVAVPVAEWIVRNIQEAA